MIIQAKTASTTIGLGTSATGDLHLTDTELGRLVDGFSSITFGSSSATGKITAAAYTYSDHLKLYSYGAGSSGIELTGAVNTGSDNLTLYTTGSVSQGASGSITAAGLELLGTGGLYVLTNTANAITTLAGNTGSVSFLENSGFVIGTVNTIGLTTSGNTTLSTIGTVTQSQKLAVSGLELLGAGGTYALTNTGAGNAVTTLAANTGVVSFTQSTAYAVGTVNTAGITTTGNLALVGSSSMTIGANISTGAGTQTYTGPITLSTGAISLASTDAAITFSGSSSTINGAQALTINNGSARITFGGVVGANIAISSLTLQGTGENYLPSAITATGAISLKGTSRTNPLQANTTLTSSSNGNVTLGETTGLYSLAISNGSGYIDLQAVGSSSSRLTTVTFSGTGINKLNSNITTTGVVNLKGTSRTTELFSDVTIATSNADVTVGTIDGGTGTADGSYRFNVDNGSGNIVAGNVGLTIKVKSLTFTGTGNTNIGTVDATNGYDLGADRGLTLNADTTYNNPNVDVILGAITLGNNVTLTLGNGGPGLISAKSISGTAGGSSGSLLGKSNVTINSVGTIRVLGAIGTDIGTITITNSGGTTFSSTVDAATVTLTNTTGVITFDGALTATTLNTAAQAYSVALNASTGMITNAVTFSNTGSLTLGTSGGTLAFNGGLTATAPSGCYAERHSKHQ
ncbi:beta strand repeat-containing protein [Polynucleobacter necessarius]|uniref:beta strand repeat-containing protein n=1 Tax=Polynucleobacter necessarius TaxID=576610 RepID=UPI000E091302|nr:hypothetical protein [Polynucleobacter necessarius]